MVIELSGVQFGLKSYARVRFEITSVSMGNCDRQLALTLPLNSIIFRGNSNIYREDESLNLLSVISWQAKAVPCKSVTKRGRLLTRTVLGAADTPCIQWTGLIAHLSSPPCGTVTRPKFRIT